MKALTLWRPWPVAMFFIQSEFRKDVENRDWPLPSWIVGQQVAIHAGSKYVEVFDDWLHIVKPNNLQVLELLHRWRDLSKLQGIIGTVRFYGFCRSDESISAWRGFEKYCWNISEPIPLKKPIPCRGAQGFWNVPLEIEKEILEQLG